MCGICGFVRFSNHPGADVNIEQMMADMAHRGPDDAGSYLGDNIRLGFVRLSIVDLSSKGHQPMSLAGTNRYTIIYNGEVYNHLELRRELEGAGHVFVSNTDTEVVLASYAEWGPDCLTKFIGMFSLAIYDLYEDSVFLARDRFGIKPLYYSQSERGIIFCSEIAPILPYIRVSINEDIVFDYLVHERLDHTEKTFYSGVLRLKPGHYIKIKNKVVVTQRWYTLADNLGMPFDDSSEYLALLQSSIELTLRGDVPVGVSLSGGLDSGAIASILAKEHGVVELPTFSSVYSPGDIGDESEYISEYSSFLNNMNYVTPTADSLLDDLSKFISVHNEPVPRTGPYIQYKVMELAQGSVKVSLDGQGADECLAGYKCLYAFYFRELFSNGRYAKLFSELKKSIYDLRDYSALSGLSSFLPGTIKDEIMKRARRDIDREFFIRHSKNSIVPHLFHEPNTLKKISISMIEHKLEYLLKWSDANSMAFSIESRVPFLDHRLVERTIATPSDKILQNGLTKHILRDSLVGILPEPVRLRNDKVGFGSPEGEWFRSLQFQELINDILSSKFYRDNRYLDTRSAREMYERHLQYKCDASRSIWKWIHLFMWHEHYIQNRRAL